MCITQIWTYRECGCHYYHPVPCHPSFTPSSTIPRRIRVGPYLSTASSSSEQSPTSTDGSAVSSNDIMPILIRQCSIRHIVHKNFLEPICDGCLLEELGLQPELGPILGGRDLQEGFHGEEWLLESHVEIKIEEPDDSKDDCTSQEQDDEEAADADDEGEFCGRTGRRRGMDISRDALRISSDMSMDEQEVLTLLREELRCTGREARKWAKAAIKAQNEGRCLKSRWSQQLRTGLSTKRGDGKQPTGVSPAENGSAGSSQRNSWTSPAFNHGLKSTTASPEDVQPPSEILPGHGRDASFDTQDEIVSLYRIAPEPGSHREAQYPSWSDHLEADLQGRKAKRASPTASMLVPDAFQRCPQPPSSSPASPQTATPFNSASWLPPSMQTLNIASSEFENDDTTTSQVPQISHGHGHTTSVDSALSTSTLCTAYSSASSPRQTAATTSPSTRRTTATSITQLSLHPLSTTLSVSTPHRPSLAPRTSSLHSPPASSPLLHSTPPLHQSPTSIFVCVHERWAFKACRCEGPSWVRSCVCDNGVGTEQGNQDDEDKPDAKDGCRAPSPIVRTRWFFNPTCEACLDREATEAET
jgi:hypothetical protein